MGKGSTTRAPKVGRWHGTNHDSNSGKQLNFYRNKSLLVPGLMYNLFSLTQAMAKGCKFIGENEAIKVQLPNNKGVISFDKKIKTKNSFVLAGILKLKPSSQ